MAFTTATYEIEDQDRIHPRNKAIYFLMGLVLFTFLLEFLFPQLPDKYFQGVLMLAFTLIWLISLLKFSEHRITTKMTGDLLLDKSGIYINGKHYPFPDIKNLKISVRDYKDQFHYRGELDARGMYAEGVLNTISFSNPSGDQIFHHFLLYHKLHQLDLKAFVMEAIAQKVLKLDDAIAILSLGNYKAIQDFKAEQQVYESEK